MNRRKKIEINKLNEYCTANTLDEYTFNYITKVASAICDTPIAYISFIVGDKISYKHVIGKLILSEASIGDNIYDNIVSNDELILIEDVLNSPKCEGFYFNAPDTRFFASTPLLTAEGRRLGALTVINTKVQTLSALQKKALTTLAAMTISEIEIRLQNKKDSLIKKQQLNKLIHDINNRNTTISLSAEIILAKLNNLNTIKQFAEKIRKTTANVVESLQQIKNINER